MVEDVIPSRLLSSRADSIKVEHWGVSLYQHDDFDKIGATESSSVVLGAILMDETAKKVLVTYRKCSFSLFGVRSFPSFQIRMRRPRLRENETNVRALLEELSSRYDIEASAADTKLFCRFVTSPSNTHVKRVLEAEETSHFYYTISKWSGRPVALKGERVRWLLLREDEKHIGEDTEDVPTTESAKKVLEILRNRAAYEDHLMPWEQPRKTSKKTIARHGAFFAASLTRRRGRKW